MYGSVAFLSALFLAAAAATELSESVSAGDAPPTTTASLESRSVLGDAIFNPTKMVASEGDKMQTMADDSKSGRRVGGFMSIYIPRPGVTPTNIGSGDSGSALDAAGTVGNGATKDGKAMEDQDWDVLGSGVDVMGEYWQKAFNMASALPSNMFNMLNMASIRPNSFTNMASSLPSSVPNMVSTLPGGPTNMASSLPSSFPNMASSLPSSVPNMASPLPSSVPNMASPLPSSVTNMGANLPTGLTPSLYYNPAASANFGAYVPARTVVTGDIRSL